MAKDLQHHSNKVRIDSSDMIIRGFTYVIVTLFSICCILPFWMIIASSFSTEEAIRRTGFTLWPSDSTLYAYELLFRSPD